MTRAYASGRARGMQPLHPKIQIYVSNPGVYRDWSPARRLCATLLQPHSPSLPHSVCSVHSVWLLPMPPRRKVYEEESEDAASGSLPIAHLMLHKTLTTRVPECHVEPQSEPIEDDELEMDVDEDADGDADGDGEGEDGDDVDIVGDGTHDDEGIVDDKDVVEEDIEDELIDVRVSLPLKSLLRVIRRFCIGRLRSGRPILSSTGTSRPFPSQTQNQAQAPASP